MVHNRAALLTGNCRPAAARVLQGGARAARTTPRAEGPRARGRWEPGPSSRPSSAAAGVNHTLTTPPAPGPRPGASQEETMNALDLCRWAVDGRYASSATLGVFPPGPEDYRDGAIIHVNGKEAASRVADRIAREAAGAFPPRPGATGRGG